MPLTTPYANESEQDFVSRFMANEAMQKEYPDEKQRAAVAHSQFRQGKTTDRIVVVDRMTYSITRREVQDNGYLKVPGRVARIGIQEYLAKELGLTDRQPNDIVRVYRPREEVFAADSLQSYDNADVTDDHPSDMVNASSFKDVAVGHAISEGRPDPEDPDFVVVDLMIKDKSAIEAIDKGKGELSAGYEAEYDPTPGTYDGQSYDFVQRSIRINHIALVDRARAGREARLFDKLPKEATNMKVITLDDGTTLEVADDASAKLIQSTINRLTKRATDAEAAAEKSEQAKEEAMAKMEKKDEELEEEKKKSSDAAIQDRVKAVADARAKAHEIAGDKFTCDSIDLLTIKREALKIVRPSVDWDKKNEHYVHAAWDVESEKDEDEREKDKGKQSTDAVSKDLEALYTGDGGVGVGDTAYSTFLNGGEK